VALLARIPKLALAPDLLGEVNLVLFGVSFLRELFFIKINYLNLK